MGGRCRIRFTQRVLRFESRLPTEIHTTALFQVNEPAKELIFCNFQRIISGYSTTRGCETSNTIQGKS